MNKLILIISALLMTSLVTANTNKSAISIAKEYLKVDFVVMDSYSKKSYFITTDLEYREDDVDQYEPCIRGIVIDRATNKIVDPTSDSHIKIRFEYSDTLIEGLVVINCAI